MSAISVSKYPAAIDPKEIQLEWQEIYSNSRMAVSFATPLFAHNLFQCEAEWSHDIPTACATVQHDRNVIYLNPDFMLNRLENDKQRAFVLLHEVLHIFLLHIGRQSDMGYNPTLWNIATDYCINLICSGAYRDNGIVRYATKYAMYLERPAGLLYDEKFIGWDSDEIYRHLLDEADGDVEEAIKQNGGGVPGEGDENGEGITLDEVSDEVLSQGQENKIKRVTSTAIASTEAAKAIGESEGDLVRKFREMFKPKISWKEIIENVVIASVKEYTTYNRLSRRTDSSSDIFFPSMTGTTVNIVFGVDTSGSMSDGDLQEAASELYGIIEQFEGWELDLITCDTTSHLIGHYSSEEGDDFTDVSLDWLGGGGTDLQSLYDFAENKAELGDEVDACIIVTDGFIPNVAVNSFGDFKTIFVVTAGGNRALIVENADVVFMDDIGK